MFFVRIVEGQPEVLTRSQLIDALGGPADVSLPEEVNWHSEAERHVYECIIDEPPETTLLQRIVAGALVAEEVEDETGRTIEVVTPPPAPEDPKDPPGEPAIELRPETAIRTRFRRGWTVEYLPLDEARAAMVTAINRKRDAIQRAGFTVPAGPLAGKTLQTRDEGDAINWLTSQAAYAAAVAAGAGAVEDAWFRTADNETVVTSYTDGHAALMMMAAWGKTWMGNSWRLKDAVAAAEDHAALEAIDIEAGWP